MPGLTDALTTIPRRTDPAAPAPLSFAQRRLWYRLQLDAENPTYRAVAALRIEGRLDIDALERSINEIVRRHDALRTVVVMHGDQPMTMAVPFTPCRLEWID